jgi:HSP20 family molecular chaperone IbpA
VRYDQKDLLKFALDLYEKTKETGLSGYWNKDRLETVLEAIKKITPDELSPFADTGRDKKNQQEEANPPQNAVPEPGRIGNVSPVSIYETAMDVNVQAVLPGIVSHEDLHLLISQEVIELFGAKVPPGGSNPVDNFHKVIRLPATVEPAEATATYRKGLLSLSVHKKKPDPPKRIPVKFE